MDIIPNNAKDLIKVFDYTPVILDTTLSEFIEVDTKITKTIIEKNRTHFETLGFLRHLKKSDCTDFFLNERQTYLLFSYLKNDEILQKNKHYIIIAFQSIQIKKPKKHKAHKKIKKALKLASIILTNKDFKRLYNESM